MSSESSPLKAVPQILLAEDTDDDAFFFLRAFRRVAIKCGYMRARDGLEAVRLIAQHEATGLLVFLDLKMPHMNGFEVLEWLRGQPFRSNVVVIILSGSDRENDIEQARALGASNYMVKPTSSAALAEVIGQWNRMQNA